MFDDEGRRGTAIDSLVSAGCVVSGAYVKGSLLFTDTRCNSYSSIEDSVLLPDVDVGRHAKIRKAVISSGARIPEGMEIGFDRELDAQRFHVSEQGVTLVTRAMLNRL